MRKIASIFAFILFFSASFPAHAVKDASVSFLDRAYDSTRSCGEAEIMYKVTATGTVVDNDNNAMGATDFVGVVITDADGNTVDVDFIFVPSSHVSFTREETIRAGINNLSQIAKLPLTATIYDIGDIYTFSGPDGTNENYQEGAAFVRTGSQISSASSDPSHYVPECRSLPGGTFVPPTPVPTVAPTPLPTPAPTATPKPDSTNTPKPTTTPTVTPRPTGTPAPVKTNSPTPSALPTSMVQQTASDSAIETSSQSTFMNEIEITEEDTPSIEHAIRMFSGTTLGRVEIAALLESANTPTVDFAMTAVNLFRLWIEFSR